MRDAFLVAAPMQQSGRARQGDERMAPLEVFRREYPPQPLFQAPDAKASTHRLHARLFPDCRADGVDLRVLVEPLLHAPVCCVQGGYLQGFFHLAPIETARSRVYAAIDAAPTFGNGPHCSLRPCSFSLALDSCRGPTRRFLRPRRASHWGDGNTVGTTVALEFPQSFSEKRLPAHTC
jgi:hypothetical protein